MIFLYCKKAQASLCKRADSQEPLLQAQDILLFITLSSDCLCKCADSPEYSLLSWIAHKSPFKAAQEILYNDEGEGKPVQMCRLARSFPARKQMAFNRRLSHHMRILNCDEGSD